MDFLCRCTLLFAILSSCSRAQDLTKYFISTPTNASIAQSESKVFGIFKCGTRTGYVPLWIINTQSVADIQNLSGYGSTYYEHNQLQGEGNYLSFLFIPASDLTNNSIVVCAAINNEQTVALSDPVYMIVLQTKPEKFTSTSELDMSSSAMPGIVSVAHQKKVLSVEWIAGLIVATCLVCGLITLLVFAGAIFIIQRRHQFQGMEEFRRVITENNYWRRDNQVFPTSDETSADFKEQNSLPQKQTC